MGSQEWVPADIDTERPSSARVYDYYLGGAHNFAADRQLAEQVIAFMPTVTAAARSNRAFLRRAVEYLLDAGVRQFLDVGSGIPTVGHVHEIAQATTPDARVVYVDIDPVAVAHSRMILDGNDRTAVIQQDVRQPELILDTPEMRLLDLDQPVAVVMVALFHFISDADDPAGLIERLTAPLASGSFLVLSHGTEDGARDAEQAEEGKSLYRRRGIELTSRTHQQVEGLFGGFQLVEPGVVWVPQWRPDSPDDVGANPESTAFYGGAGRKP